MVGVSKKKSTSRDLWFSNLLVRYRFLKSVLYKFTFGFCFCFGIVGYLSISVMNATSTLMIDLVPDQSSSVTACVRTLYFFHLSLSSSISQNNLIRCTLSAVLISVIELILRAIGTGWTYVLLAGLSLLSLPLTYLVIRIGPRCRTNRKALREEARHEGQNWSGRCFKVGHGLIAQ
jgi:hypothetical protein